MNGPGSSSLLTKAQQRLEKKLARKRQQQQPRTFPFIFRTKGEKDGKVVYGEVEREFSITVEDYVPIAVEKRVKVFGKCVRLPKGSEKKHLTTTVTLLGTRVEFVLLKRGKNQGAQLAEGVPMKAVSCCKPPDKFDVLQGRKHALSNLFAADGGKYFDDLDHQIIFRRICKKLFRKKKS